MKIKFIAQTDNTTFYVDAVSFTQSGSPQPYKPLMGPRALWMEAGRYLKKYGGDKPDVWQGEGMDRAYESAAKEITIGSWVTVQEDWNGSSFDTEKVLRVIGLSYSDNQQTGRRRKRLKLASARSDASHFFQQNYVTKSDMQGEVSVENVPNEGLYSIDERNNIFSFIEQNAAKIELGVSTLEYLEYSDFQDVIFSDGTRLASGEDNEAALFQGVGSEIEITRDHVAAVVNDVEGNTASLIIQASQIQSTVSAVNGNSSQITQNANSITSIVSDVNGNSSTIRQLSDEIVLKITNNGEITAISLDGDPADGTNITISADNISLDGVVEFINNTGPTTTIDGGKITAESKITVGTGDNVAVLDGVNDTYRMYAGSSNPNNAPFRVAQNGTVVTTRLLSLTGIGDFEGTIDNIKLQNLEIGGNLKITTGQILLKDNPAASNAVIDENAISIYGDYKINVLQLPGTAGWSSPAGSIYGDSSDAITLQTPYDDIVNNRYHLGINLNGYLGSSVPADDAQIDSTTINVFSSYAKLEPTAAFQHIEFINMNGKSPELFDRVYILNDSPNVLEYFDGGNIDPRGGTGGSMKQRGHTVALFMWNGTNWVKDSDYGD